MDAIVLGRYRLDELLGSGGMADVWLATDEETGGGVAVKRLHRHVAGDPAMVERFHAEAAAAAAVDHPNVIKVLDSGPDVIVLEYIHGESLADRIRRGRVERPLVERVGGGLAAALAAVHAAGFVHRDVTPGNVLLDETGVAHLADFGIARPLETGNGVTATADLIGTWRYVAPEVLAGATATPASDVWALGATLYEALTAHPPYPASSPAELIEARRVAAPPIDDSPLAALLARMLDPDPAQRPSATAVSTALSASPEALTQVLAIPAPAVATTGESNPVGVAKLRPSPPSAPKRAPLPARQAGLAAAGLLVAAGFVLAAASPADPAASGAPPPLPSPSPAVSRTPQPTVKPSPRPSATSRPPAPRARRQGHSGHHGKHGRAPHGGDHGPGGGDKQGGHHGDGSHGGNGHGRGPGHDG